MKKPSTPICDYSPDVRRQALLELQKEEADWQEFQQMMREAWHRHHNPPFPWGWLLLTVALLFLLALNSTKEPTPVNTNENWQH